MRRLATASHCASRPGPDWGPGPPTCQESGAIAPKCKCRDGVCFGLAVASGLAAAHRRLAAKAHAGFSAIAHTCVQRPQLTRITPSMQGLPPENRRQHGHTPQIEFSPAKSKSRKIGATFRLGATRLSEPGAVVRASRRANLCGHQGAATPGCCISSSNASVLSVTLAWPITNSVTLFSSTAASASAMRFWSA